MKRRQRKIEDKRKKPRSDEERFKQLEQEEIERKELESQKKFIKGQASRLISYRNLRSHELEGREDILGRSQLEALNTLDFENAFFWMDALLHKPYSIIKPQKNRSLHDKEDFAVHREWQPDEYYGIKQFVPKERRENHKINVVKIIKQEDESERSPTPILNSNNEIDNELQELIEFHKSLQEEFKESDFFVKVTPDPKKDKVKNR